jgi:hypothetical protein
VLVGGHASTDIFLKLANRISEFISMLNSVSKFI